jgi:hypothetical protein
MLEKTASVMLGAAKNLNGEESQVEGRKSIVEGQKLNERALAFDV